MNPLEHPSNGEPAGLTDAEAAARLSADGPNELPRERARTLARIGLDTIREPMFALLFAAAGIYLVLGSLEEALVLLLLNCVTIGIAIVQEGRSEHVLDRLRDLSSPRALVVRQHTRRRVPGREVVRGDIIVLREGDRVPADAVVRVASDLSVDESLLTGEAVSVRKREAAADTGGASSGEENSTVLSGTLVVRGQGIAEVIATGSRSRIGQIGRILSTIESGTPRLTKETRSVVRIMAAVGLVCCAAVILLFGMFRGSWLQASLAGIALGMSVLPEEFPLIITVFTVMGAWRLSRARVLTRRAAAIETLGSATVLCTDKTGTLTENQMSIVQLRTEHKLFDVAEGNPGGLDESLLRLVEIGVLASALEPFDPMEKAFHALHAAASFGAAAGVGRKFLKLYPLEPHFLAVTQAWGEEGVDGTLIAVKGAPEAVIDLCRLDPDRAKAARKAAGEMAGRGMRVLAVAEARHHGAPLPETPHQFEFLYRGLVGLADPLRANVPAAVRECRTAGIRVIMITGDHPETARAIAYQAGLQSEQVLSGRELAQLGDGELKVAVARVDVFARITPEQKLSLVRALQSLDEVVAMTGDGVNDAPALRAADIGVAMGGRGTDVAREASSLILLDDDFASIVRTIRLGRRIYDNLRKAMSYILAVHVPIAGMALLPLLTGLPLIFAPIHIAFLEMVIDPVCSIVFEAEEEEEYIMRRPPRPPSVHLLSPKLVRWSLLQGSLALVVVAAIYLVGSFAEMPATDLRTLAFIALVTANLGLILVNRTFDASVFTQLGRPNLALVVVSTIAISTIAVAVLWQPARAVFEFGTFHLHDLGIVAAATLLLVLALDGIKWVLAAKPGPARSPNPWRGLDPS
jgi:Ca2+-transporting ATPase